LQVSEKVLCRLSWPITVLIGFLRRKVGEQAREAYINLKRI